MNLYLKLMLSTISLLIVTESFAQELKESEPVEEENTELNWPLLQASDKDNNKYRGVASMDYEGFACTAFLIKPPECSSKNQKAIMVTNGHCTKAYGAQNVISNQPTTIPKFKFGDMAGAKESEVVVANGTKILHSSMRGKDIAVIEINKTYAELEAQGIPAYQMAPAVIPQEITTVGRPFDGIAASERYLRQAQCKMEKRVGVIEGDWHWPFAVAANCPAAKGASGSPMFNEKGQVVGLLNSGSMNPGPSSPRCPTNSPCEITADGKYNYVPNSSYGFETGFLNSCFNKCAWDGANKNCDLAKASAPDFGIQKTHMQRLGVNFTLPQPYTNARYKMVPLGAGGCFDPNGYTDAPMKLNMVSLEQNSKNQSAEGKYQLCIIGGVKDESGKIKWDGTEKAYGQNVTIDRTPPRAKVEIRDKYISYAVENPLDVAESSVVAKYVSDKKDCNKPKDYKAQKGPPWGFPSNDKFLCISSVDWAGNWQLEPIIIDSSKQQVK